MSLQYVLNRIVTSSGGKEVRYSMSSTKRLAQAAGVGLPCANYPWSKLLRETAEAQ